MKQALVIVHADSPYMKGFKVHDYLEAALQAETEKRLNQGDPVFFLDTRPGRVPCYLDDFRDDLIVISSTIHKTDSRFVSQYFNTKKKAIELGVQHAVVGGLYFNQCPKTVTDLFNGNPPQYFAPVLSRHFNLSAAEIEETTKKQIPATLCGRLTDIFKHADGNIISIAAEHGIELTEEDVTVYKIFRSDL